MQQPSLRLCWVRSAFFLFAASVLGVRPTFAVALQASQISEKINIWELLAAATYGLLGIALAVLGYLIFEWITPFSVGKELAEEKNIAVGIVVAGIIIGISIIIASAVS
jgi:hypothetical protein